MKYSKVCEHCESKVTAYTHSLNRQMVTAFNVVVEQYLATRNPVNVYALDRLDYNQKCNFQKLRYFGLMDFIGGAGWYPTQLGLKFYYGERSVQTPVATMGNKVLPDNHEAWDTHGPKRRWVYAMDLADDWAYKRRPEYQAEKSPQTTLF